MIDLIAKLACIICGTVLLVAGCDGRFTGGSKSLNPAPMVGAPGAKLTKTIDVNDEFSLLVGTGKFGTSAPIIVLTRKGLPIVRIDAYGNSQQVFIKENGEEVLMAMSMFPPKPGANCGVTRIVHDEDGEKWFVSYDEMGEVESRVRRSDNK